MFGRSSKHSSDRSTASLLEVLYLRKLVWIALRRRRASWRKNRLSPMKSAHPSHVQKTEVSLSSSMHELLADSAK